MTGIGSGAVGAAVMGVLALGASPANAPGAVVRPGAESFGIDPDPRDHLGHRPRAAGRPAAVTTAQARPAGGSGPGSYTRAVGPARALRAGSMPGRHPVESKDP